MDDKKGLAPFIWVNFKQITWIQAISGWFPEAPRFRCEVAVSYNLPIYYHILPIYYPYITYIYIYHHILPYITIYYHILPYITQKIPIYYPYITIYYHILPIYYHILPYITIYYPKNTHLLPIYYHILPYITHILPIYDIIYPYLPRFTQIYPDLWNPPTGTQATLRNKLQGRVSVAPTCHRPPQRRFSPSPDDGAAGGNPRELLQKHWGPVRWWVKRLPSVPSNISLVNGCESGFFNGFCLTSASQNWTKTLDPVVPWRWPGEIIGKCWQIVRGQEINSKHGGHGLDMTGLSPTSNYWYSNPQSCSIFLTRSKGGNMWKPFVEMGPKSREVRNWIWKTEGWKHQTEESLLQLQTKTLWTLSTSWSILYTPC